MEEKCSRTLNDRSRLRAAVSFSESCGVALCVLAALAVIVTTSGCGAPPATLELVSVAQKAISDASAYERDRHAETLSRLDGQSASLDAAFDADVKLIAAGGITDSTGKPIPLTAEWVISARKGYAAARDALARQRRRNQASHATHQDNLSAAVEALDLARMLIIQHSTLTGRARQFVMSLQRRFTNGR